MEKYLVAYFSGTGSTKLAAKEIVKQLKENNIEAILASMSEQIDYTHNNLIIMYPVYAFDAPELVLDWINNYNNDNLKNVAIIAVSGGGEIFPNTACCLKVKNNLKKKGISTTYETMIIMPSNFAITLDKQINSALIKVLPNKVSKIITDLKMENKKIMKSSFFDRLILSISKSKKTYTKYWGHKIQCNNNCNSCNKCVTNCPTNNIRLVNNKIIFDKNCCMCLYCIYNCPQNALYPKKFKFIILKEGYNLDEYIKYSNSVDMTILKYPKGILWKAVRNYLKDK